MGDWAYYITFMRFSDIRYWIKQTDEIHSSEGLRDLIQRKLTNRSKDIAEYLVKQKERFFNSIVVGVYDGIPEWYALEVGDSPLPTAPELDDESRYAMGFLAFEGTEKLFAIDGQHRVEGIKQALTQKPELGDDEQSVLFVAHRTDEAGRERTRRLFTTLNKHAKRVSKTDIIALDEDDAFAVTTRRLVDNFSLFNTGFVNFKARRADIPRSDQVSLTTVVTLNDIVECVYIPVETSRRGYKLKNLKQMRPSEDTLTAIYDEQVWYWNALKENVSEYNELFSSEPSKKVAEKYRNSEGGHLLFRPMGQLAFARAVGIIKERGQSIEKAVEALSNVPMNLSQPPWVYVFWNPTQKKMIKPNSWLAESLLLHQVGHPPRKQPRKDLLIEYRKAVDNPGAELPDVIYRLTMI
jgi:DNA sulfur modification protein DndB